MEEFENCWEFKMLLLRSTTRNNKENVFVVSGYVVTILCTEIQAFRISGGGYQLQKYDIL